MKLEIKKSLTGGVFKVDLAFKSYEVFEEGLMEDFGTPELIIPVSEWTGEAEIREDGKYEFTEVTKNSTEKNCDIEIEKEIKASLDASFKTSFEVRIADIEEADLASPLDTVVKMAEAKCALFIEIVRTEAKKKMDYLREMKTSFESAIKNPETIKI